MSAPLPPAYLFINVLCHLLHTQEGRASQVKQLQSRPSSISGGVGWGGRAGWRSALGSKCDAQNTYVESVEWKTDLQGNESGINLLAMLARLFQ